MCCLILLLWYLQRLKHLGQRFQKKKKKRRRNPEVLCLLLSSRKHKVSTNSCTIKLGRCRDTGEISKRLRRLGLQSLWPDVTLISFFGCWNRCTEPKSTFSWCLQQLILWFHFFFDSVCSISIYYLWIAKNPFITVFRFTNLLFPHPPTLSESSEKAV